GDFINLTDSQDKIIDFSCSLNIIYACNFYNQYGGKLQENTTYKVDYFNIKGQFPLVIKIYDLDNRLIKDFSIRYKNEQKTLKLEKLFYLISITLSLLLVLTIRIK
ncbi:MAG: hypothetical protein RR939_01435, partial [Acinetobacter sp.]